MNFIAFRLQPHNHSKKVAKFYYATPELVQKAITTSLEAKKEWERVPLEDRMQMYLRVADQMAGEYRQVSTFVSLQGHKLELCRITADSDAVKSNVKIFLHM